MNDHFRFFFHKNSIIGLSFADYEDASNFERAIERYTKSLSKNPNLRKSKKLFSKPLIFELKENVRWDTAQHVPDMNSCSRKFKHIVKMFKINFLKNTRNKILVDVEQ